MMKRGMHRNMNIKKILKLTAIIGGGLAIIGGLTVGVTGYWPIAMVGYAPITYEEFRENFMMADHFYRSNIKIAGEDERMAEARDIQRDIQRATLEGLIERILIERELRERYSKEDLRQLIENKLSGVDLDSKDMQKGTELLYGLTPQQFKELVLVPKAQQEILEGNLSLRDGSFNGWLAEKKKAARISVFVPSFYWNGEGVQAR